MSGSARLVTRYKTAGKIDHITKAVIRTYEDNDTTVAYVEWVDDKGKSGRTEGNPENAHMKALLDRAKREKVKVEKEKWASSSPEWIFREASRRNERILRQERVAANLTDVAWNRGVVAIIETSTAMKKQVDRFGSVEQALQEGHGTTLKQQMNELSSLVRTLQRRLGD